ncbi:phospholipase D family protein [Paracidovorax konjaci]|uniref:PLD-like domain-containing protein n=1 Tax=Paracidovorax konjaci TaxID=32040 RepID=A0A1I1RRQ5_9BURK|nr:phospholipase D family protein [Paracidovorax konjaci]SFD37026.1 PLD-like domain-containing protein [Paracidovorax konjaci]
MPDGLAPLFRSPAAVGRWCAALAIVLSTVACSGLPQNVERPESHALPASADTTLSRMAQEQRQAASGRHASGFVLLSGPQDAYGSRLALVEAAQKTLDLQYYAIHADASTERLLRGVVGAAQRGVRVRVLLDDFHSTGRNALVMGLAFQPNIEMRMFNPVAGPRGSMVGRLWGSLTDFSRVQQRMHNKLFIADNAMGVTGGRNLGDAYFGQADSGNFVDLDVLAAGPIVAEMSRSFDAYWNNPRAYPVQSLITREELSRLRDQTRGRYDAQRAEGDRDAPPASAARGERPAAGTGGSGGPRPPDGEPRPGPDQPTAEQRARVWNERPMDLRAARFVWAPAVMLVDRPAKIPAEGEPSSPRTSTPGAGLQVHGPQGPVAPAQAPAADGAGTASLQASAAHAAEGETVVDGVLQLLGQARQNLLIISPYFVPGDDMKRAFADARARGVRVRVLTNSLASNDAPVAHVGYARHREELLAMGIELYEMRSEQAGVKSAFGSSGAGATGPSRAMLHSKVVVVDGRLIAIGSMNLDLRSQLQNTEIALLIQSRTLSRTASEQIEAAMRDVSWRVERAQDGTLVWRAPEGSGLEDATTEPDAGLGLRMLLKLLGPLAPDHLL